MPWTSSLMAAVLWDRECKWQGTLWWQSQRLTESNPLPAGTSEEKAELIALIRALELAKGKKINIWTDSKYAGGIFYAHRVIWRERGLLIAQKKIIKYAAEILRLLEVVKLPLQVAIIHCQGHSKGNTLPEAGNKFADYEARIAAERNEPIVAALIPTAVSTKQPVKYQPSDYKWINENEKKLLENS